MNFFANADEYTDEQLIALTRGWVERVVIGLNLCPFAKPVHVKNQISYTLSQARDPEALIADLRRALMSLTETAPESIDTCLLIHPWVLTDFIDYNDFLDVADVIIEESDLTGVLQIASFHPMYQFVGTTPEDVTNCTNRSPFPMLHLLRETSLDKATATLTDANLIVERNLQTMITLGHDGWIDLQLELNKSLR